MSEEMRHCPVCDRRVADQSFCKGRAQDGWGRMMRHRFVGVKSTDPHALMKPAEAPKPEPAAGKARCPQCQGELQELQGSPELGGPPPSLSCETCNMVWAIESDGSRGRLIMRLTFDSGEEHA